MKCDILDKTKNGQPHTHVSDWPWWWFGIGENTECKFVIFTNSHSWGPIHLMMINKIK